MAKRFREPSRAAVQRIIREEAIAARVRVADVWGTSRKAKAVDVRWSAIRRIIKETGCSQRGLARVWGLSVGCVAGAIRQRQQREGAYDAATRDQLAWQYGGARARLIARGHDQATQSDLTRWNRLGGMRVAA